MKKDLHPAYHRDITITCSCGATFLAGSTREELSTELCSNCHPFYTGKQKVIDTAGRIEKFKQRQTASQELSAKRAAEAQAAKERPKTEEAAVIDATLAVTPATEHASTLISVDAAPEVAEQADVSVAHATAPEKKAPAKKAPAKTAAKKAPVKTAAKKAPAKKAPAKAAAKKAPAKKAPAKKASKK